MKPRPFLFALATLFLTITASAQDNTERLAYELYSKQEYKQAYELYDKVFQEKRNSYYFNMAVTCLFQLRDYETAEKKLRDYIKKYPKQVKQQIDLGYVYQMTGDSDKAKRQYEKAIKNILPTKNDFLEAGNAFNARRLFDYAITVFDKGAANDKINYDFLIEKARTYHSMLDIDKSVAAYLDYLETNPNQYEFVKSSIRTLMYYDIDGTINDKIRRELLKKAQKNIDNEMFSELIVWYSLQQQDYDLALEYEIALDGRGNERLGNIIYLGDIAASNMIYDVAIRAYKYAADKYPDGGRHNEAEVKMIKAVYDEGNRERREDDFYIELYNKVEKIVTEIGFSEQVIPIIIIEADILAYKMNRHDEAVKLLDNALLLNIRESVKAEIKLQKADIMLFINDVWEATLLYSQVEKSMNDAPVAHEARFRNARLRYFIGEFEWAQTSLDILKASTSKLIANDAMSLSLIIKDNISTDTTALRMLAKADYDIYRKHLDEADKTLDSLIVSRQNESITPYALLRKAQIFESRQKYQEADSIYNVIFNDFPESFIADEALVQDANILRKHLNDNEKAAQCYLTIIDKYTASVYLAEAKRNYRIITKSSVNQ